MKTPMDRRTAIASTIAASAIAVSPRLFAFEETSSAGMAKIEEDVAAQGQPTQREFVGLWRINGQEEAFEISLEGDETFTMKCFSLPRVGSGKGEFKWGGKGDWAVRYGSLLLHKTHKWMWVGWGEDSHTIYDWRPVVDITPSEIILANNVKLERR